MLLLVAPPPFVFSLTRELLLTGAQYGHEGLTMVSGGIFGALLSTQLYLLPSPDFKSSSPFQKKKKKKRKRKLAKIKRKYSQ